MIVRIVQMSFRQDDITTFTNLFEERKQTIRNFPGCTHLELWQDSKDPHILFTCSHWDSEESLNHYRFSSFFKDTWSKTKALFADAPKAWSMVIRSTTE